MEKYVSVIVWVYNKRNETWITGFFFCCENGLDNEFWGKKRVDRR